MTAAEHIAQAERLLAAAGEEFANGGLDFHDAQVAAAQVHATLAVAEATIEANRLRPAPSYGGPR